jgi:regulator of replication initiation timing
LPIDPTVIVTAVLTGTVFTGLGALWTARTNAKKVQSDIKTIDQNAPLHMASTMLKGSEDAMLIMQQANDNLVRELSRKDQELAQSVEENADLRAENHRLHARVLSLEGRLASVQEQLVAAYKIAADLGAALADVQRGYDGLQREIAAIKES